MSKMKSLSLIAAAAGALAMAAPAHAVMYTFSAVLTGAAESPPVATTAIGTSLVTMDDITLGVAVQTIWIGLTGGPANAGHIHCCTAVAGTGNVGVFVPFTSFPAGLVTGAYTNTFTLTAPNFATLLAGAQGGKAYINIHNVGNPGGEIRGFLIGAPVPEPSTYALMLAGVAALGFMVRKRQQG